MPYWRPQFSLRGIMLATLWMAVAFAIYTAHSRYGRERVEMPLEIPLTWLMMIAPFVAVGALFGRSIIGAAVGLVAVTGFWMVFWMT